MFFKKLFSFLQNRIADGYSHNEQPVYNTSSIIQKEKDPYLEKVAVENNAEYNVALGRISVSSLTGRVDYLENAYRVISDVYDCSDMMYDRFTKNWFFNIKGLKKQKN